MKKIGVVLLMLVLASGCMLRKTQLNEDKKLQGIENLETIETKVTNTTGSTKLAKQKKTNVTDKTVTTEKETKYSKPDSTGIQYKVIERIIEKRNDVTTKNELNEMLLQVKDEQIKRIDSENKRMEYWMNEIIKLKEKSKPQTPWAWLVVAFILGVVVVNVLRIWKRL